MVIACQTYMGNKAHVWKHGNRKLTQDCSMLSTWETTAADGPSQEGSGGVQLGM